jgi:hypothetical protein
MPLGERYLDNRERFLDAADRWLRLRHQLQLRRGEGGHRREAP